MIDKAKLCGPFGTVEGELLTGLVITVPVPGGGGAYFAPLTIVANYRESPDVLRLSASRGQSHFAALKYGGKTWNIHGASVVHSESRGDTIMVVMVINGFERFD